MDVSSLPKAMQVRQGKFGKRGQTKYTHLVDQDTSSKDAGWSSAMGGKGSSMACHNCGSVFALVIALTLAVDLMHVATLRQLR